VRVWVAIVVGLVLVCSGAAHAQEASAVARTGLGYDTNPVYVATRSAAVPGVMGPTEPAAYAGLDAAAGLASAGAGPRFALALDASARVYFNGETLSFLRLSGGADTRLSPDVVLKTQLDVSRFDTSLSGDEATAARLRIGAQSAATRRLLLSAELSGGGRLYDSGGQRDALLGGGVDARMSLGRRARIRVGLDVERRASDVLRATRWELAPWVTLAIDATRTVRLSAAYALYVRSFDVPRRSGVEHIARVEASWMPWRAFGFFATLEGGLARGDTAALRYERLDAMVGVRVALAPAPTLGDDGAETDAPSLVDGPTSPGPRAGTTHFRVAAAAGSTVAIVGSFNDWSEVRGRLAEHAPGIFEADLEVPAGRHRYHVIIDAQPARPTGAARYVDDGFGGEDAVLEVSGD